MNLKHPKVQLKELGLLLYKIKIIIINSIKTAGKNKNMSFLNKIFFFLRTSLQQKQPIIKYINKKSATSDFELSNSSWSTNSGDKQKRKKKKTFFHQ